MAKSKQVGRNANRVPRKPPPAGTTSARKATGRLVARRAITAQTLTSMSAADEFRNMAPPEPPANAPLMAAVRASLANPEAKAEPQPAPAPRVSRGAVQRTAAPRAARAVRAKVPEARVAELITEMKIPGRKPLEEAELYRQLQNETRLSPAALARLIVPDQKSERGGEVGKWWDRIIWRNQLLELSPELQQAVNDGEIGADREVGELWRAPEAKRDALAARLKDGSVKGKSAPVIRRYCDAVLAGL